MAEVAATLTSRPSFNSFSSSNTSHKQYVRLQKNIGTASFGQKDNETWAKSDEPTELEPRFAELKKRLVRPENYAAVQASWERLLISLEEKAAEIKKKGPEVRLKTRREEETLLMIRKVHSKSRFLVYRR
jgi:hypothetical protein